MQHDIEQVISQTAQSIDEILIDAWQAHFPGNTRISLLAVGGYGRRELNIHSDIDILLLHDFRAPIEKALEALGLDTFIQFLWDIGLEVGHSVRSVEECLKQANRDISVMTTLLEARLLVGKQSTV